MIAWSLIDLASGVPATLPWASRVFMTVPGSDPVTLTAREADDADRWPEALRAAMVDGLAEARAAGGRWTLRSDAEMRFGGYTAYDVSLTDAAGTPLPWHLVVSVGNGLFGPVDKLVDIELIPKAPQRQ